MANADITLLPSSTRDRPGFTVIAIKSTVPVEIEDEIERLIIDNNPLADFAVVSNPEFLRKVDGDS
jgi:UDP-glucose 6-dehydrogenase